jgi:transposase
MPPANRHNPQRAKSSQSLYSLHEFQREFGNDEACLEWLWRERHSADGEHAYCPKCGQERSFKRYDKLKPTRQSWTCTACGHHVHPTAGTIFEKSSRPLTDWFYVIYLVSSSRCGIAAKHVERELGCNYKTAWRMLNKVRNYLMEQNDGEQIGGIVEADETFIGGKTIREAEKRKLRAAGSVDERGVVKPRQVVVGAVERGGKLRAAVVPSRSHAVATVREFVLPGSMIFTDDWNIYERLTHTRRGRKDKYQYRHRRVNHSLRVYVDGPVHTNTIEGFWAHFKTDLRGTHHSVSAKWLPSYLNEWVWKWNHRDDDKAMFRSLLDNAAQPL